jgi:hypothetical protein
MKQARETITTAAMLSLVVIVPASVLMGIAYQLSRNEVISSTIFFGAFLADLIGVFWWASQHVAPAAQKARMSVHQFIAYLKMHPERMPEGVTEFDLEHFRERHSERNQAGLDAWIKRFRQFRGATKAARPSSQIR